MLINQLNIAFFSLISLLGYFKPVNEKILFPDYILILTLLFVVAISVHQLSIKTKKEILNFKEFQLFFLALLIFTIRKYYFPGTAFSRDEIEDLRLSTQYFPFFACAAQSQQPLSCAIKLGLSHFTETTLSVLHIWPTIIFSLLSIYLFIKILLEFNLNKWFVLVFTLGFAFHPRIIEHSYQIRPYSLTVYLSLYYFYELFKFCTNPANQNTKNKIWILALALLLLLSVGLQPFVWIFTLLITLIVFNKKLKISLPTSFIISHGVILALAAAVVLTSIYTSATALQPLQNAINGYFKLENKSIFKLSAHILKSFWPVEIIYFLIFSLLVNIRTKKIFFTLSFIFWQVLFFTVYAFLFLFVINETFNSRYYIINFSIFYAVLAIIFQIYYEKNKSITWKFFFTASSIFFNLYITTYLHQTERVMNQYDLYSIGPEIDKLIQPSDQVGIVCMSLTSRACVTSGIDQAQSYYFNPALKFTSTSQIRSLSMFTFDQILKHKGNDFYLIPVSHLQTFSISNKIFKIECLKVKKINSQYIFILNNSCQDVRKTYVQIIDSIKKNPQNFSYIELQIQKALLEKNLQDFAYWSKKLNDPELNPRIKLNVRGLQNYYYDIYKSNLNSN